MALVSKAYKHPHQLVRTAGGLYVPALYECYVSSLYGSNSNDGKTPERPFQTITHAMDQLPYDTVASAWYAPSIIHVFDYDLDDVDAVSTNPDDTPITISRSNVSVLFHGTNNVVKAIASADQIFVLSGNHIKIGAANPWVDAVYVEDALAGTTSTVVEITGTHCHVFGFQTDDTLDNYDEVITVGATAHHARIYKNVFAGDTTDTDEGIDIKGTVRDVWIYENDFSNCGVGSGNIYCHFIATQLRIFRNRIDERGTSKKGIIIDVAATGQIYENYLFTDTTANALDPGSCANFENYAVNAIDTGGYIRPAIGTP